MQQQHGSGKTAVLVERIINKIINENIDIDRLLVVTFTNAAASEMRERVLNAIYKKLDEDFENQNLQRQITLLNKASICTIDSFCLEVVRNNFYELENISPNFRIADTTEIELLKQETIEEIFEKKYEEQNKDFEKLINTYTSYRDDTPLKDLVLKIYTYIQSSPFPEEWLKEKIEMFNLKDKLEEDFSNTKWGSILLQELKEEIIDDIVTLDKVHETLAFDPELEKFEQVLRTDLDMLENLKNHLNNWDDAYKINQNFKFVDWPRKKVDTDIKEQAKSIRDDIKNKLNKKRDKILVTNSREANQDIFDMYEILLKLQDLILKFGDEFSKKKREKNIVDFNDIEHFALNILLKRDENGNVEPTQVAKTYQEKFIEIAIDEYQDSNLVQEYILGAISKQNNIFMVGDVKQSIYKFRQAMPELFLSKYKDYKLKENQNKDEHLKIQLFKNFRSRKNILDFTNIIFQNIMSEDLGDIDYNKQEYLNLGANYEEIDQDLKTEINIIDLKEEVTENNINEDEQEEKEDEKIEDIELEARFVSNRIKKLIDEKYQVFDRKKNTYRDITYKDIVILLRSTKTTAPIYEQELLNLEIPVFSDASQEYLDSIEIQTIICLLKIIDNPIQDIPLVTVLRSNIGKFTDNDLVKIRLTDKYDNFYTCLQKAKVNVDKGLKGKIENFLNNLETWRKEQEYLALDELIWKIYSDTGYYNYVGLMPNGELRQANLRMLFERAKKYETASFKGLYNFIKFIEKLKLSSGDMSSAKVIGENDDVVRIMSIHKSTGLEFPVVFLASTGRQFNLMDLNDDILIHQDLGIGVKYIDYEKQVQYDTLTKSAIRNKILTETLSEEMRVLYVALTRAKEKLIITGLLKDANKEFENIEKQVERYNKSNEKVNYILLKKCKKYIDWILLVYKYEEESIKNIATLNTYNKKELLKTFKTVENDKIDVIKELEKHEKDENQIKWIKEILNYQYKYLLSTILPTKTSVTKIKEMENGNFSIFDDISMIDGDFENDDILVSLRNEKIQESSDNNKEAENNTEKLQNIDNLNRDKKETQNFNNIKKEENFKKPKFLNDNKEEKISSAKKGTIIHLCMQNLDVNIDYDLNKVNELIRDLLNRNIITNLEAESINPYKILEFTKTDIWKDLKQAKEIYREKPFYINIPIKDILKKSTLDLDNIKDESILVQGIIDLYYISKDDKLVLLDYKTDYVEKGKENLLLDKYNKQLEIYKDALESALDRKVDKTFIYSVYLGKCI